MTEGKLTGIDGWTITVVDDDGDQTAHVLNSKTRIERNGKKCRLSDLCTGDRLMVSDGDPVKSVAATGS